MSAAKQVPAMSAEQTKAFWAKVARRPDGCWEWTAHRSANGYGKFSIGPVTRRAHRIAWVLAHGEPPVGLDLDHLCRNRACVNPAHLDPVTRRENLRRGEGNGSKTHCPQGHSYADAYRERDGSRKCRTCMKARHRDRYRNNPAYRAASLESARRSYERRRAAAGVEL